MIFAFRERRKSTPFRDQYDSEIVDVGGRRTGYDEIVQRCKYAIGIVVREAGFGVDPGCARTPQRVGCKDRSGIVFAAVDSVGICGERPNAVPAVSGNAETQQKFGIAPTAAAAADRNGRFTAGDKKAGISSG